MTPARVAVCTRVLGWRALVESTCGLDPWLLLALIAQESGGDPWAIRVERGFFRRYHEGLVALVRSTVSTRDDYWMQYPDLFSASYGLTQIMLPVAIELGFTFRYPTELCDPTPNVALGSMKLRACFRPVVSGELEPIRAALLRYNGGGDPEYPDRVLAWRRDLIEVG